MKEQQIFSAGKKARSIMKFEIMKIHHIGIACENIKQTVDDFCAAHNVLDITDIIYDE
jgi:hypothetical protein